MANVCVDGSIGVDETAKKDLLSAQPGEHLDAPGADEEVGLHVDDEALKSALSEIADPYREALVLRFVDELNYDEVAAVAGVSEQNARARVSRASSDEISHERCSSAAGSLNWVTQER